LECMLSLDRQKVEMCLKVLMGAYLRLAENVKIDDFLK
jgi:hypothetical protein